MKYTDDELSFILYNNRSINGVVKNFIRPTWNGYKISKIEEMMDHFRSLFDGHRFIEVKKDVLICNGDDVIVYK